MLYLSLSHLVICIRYYVFPDHLSIVGMIPDWGVYSSGRKQYGKFCRYVGTICLIREECSRERSARRVSDLQICWQVYLEKYELNMTIGEKSPMLTLQRSERPCIDWLALTK